MGYLVRLAFMIGAAALFTACGNGIQPSGPSELPPGVAAPRPNADAPLLSRRARKPTHWMSDRAGARHRSKIIYVSDAYDGSVEAYDYKTGSLLGAASGFGLPYGLCSDTRGNVYATDFYANVYEIKARTTTVIKSWNTGGSPIGCSVNPVNGDLAVTDFANVDGPCGPGGVYIIPRGSSRGTLYKGPGYEDWPAGYDDHGNLYLECNECGSPWGPNLAELSTKSGSFTFINISGATLHSPGGVEWDGKHLGLDDQECSSSTLCIYQTTVSGSTAQVLNTVQFSCPSGHPSFLQWAEVARHPNGQTKSPAKEAAAGAYGCGSSQTTMSVWSYIIE